MAERTKHKVHVLPLMHTNRGQKYLLEGMLVKPCCVYHKIPQMIVEIRGDFEYISLICDACWVPPGFVEANVLEVEFPVFRVARFEAHDSQIHLRQLSVPKSPYVCSMLLIIGSTLSICLLNYPMEQSPYLLIALSESSDEIFPPTFPFDLFHIRKLRDKEFLLEISPPKDLSSLHERTELPV